MELFIRMAFWITKKMVVMRMNLFLVCSVFLLLVHCEFIDSSVVLVCGETFEIAEKDILEQIFSRLKGLQETGKLEAEQKKVTERIKKMIFHPQDIAGITHTQTRREYTFDPMIAVLPV